MRNKRKATRQGKPGRFSFENEHHFSSYSASTATRSSIHREIFSMISSPAIAADHSAAPASPAALRAALAAIHSPAIAAAHSAALAADSADHADHADHSADLAALAVDHSPAIAVDHSAAHADSAAIAADSAAIAADLADSAFSSVGAASHRLAASIAARGRLSSGYIFSKFSSTSSAAKIDNATLSCFCQRQTRTRRIFCQASLSSLTIEAPLTSTCARISPCT